MWLINTATLSLEKFQEPPAKTYAILSHTWGADAEELDFDEFKAGGGREKTGFEKIRLCCEEAKKNDIQYAWVDTCCIDKRSSTELSEAINSMFVWYAKSKVCYVYLADVSLSHPVNTLTSGSLRRVWAKSRWFTRGWTLQELVAPNTLTFFTKDWTEIGDKVNLANDIWEITQIDVDVLRLQKSFLDCSVAHRMSWASRRRTTRLEDSAYCLLGLFDVNLPLMYGEGSKAFLRLQKQIIEQTNDETIFAWQVVPKGGSGLLAPNAAHFAKPSAIEFPLTVHTYRDRSHYFSTNKGLSFECQLIPYAMNTYLVPLNCRLNGRQPAIFLTKSFNDDQYRRVPYEGDSFFLDKLGVGRTPKPQIRRIFVPHDGRGLRLAPHGGLPFLSIRSYLEIPRMKPGSHGFVVEGERDSVQHEDDGEGDRILCIPPTTYRIQFGQSQFHQGIGIPFTRTRKPDSPYDGSFLHFGFDENFKPICILYIKSRLSPSFDSDLRAYQSFFDDTRFWSHAKAKGDLFRYDDPKGISLRLSINLCEYIEVSFRPCGSLSFELTVSERQRHKRKWTSFCFKCLGIRLCASMFIATFAMVDFTQAPRFDDRYIFSTIIILVALMFFSTVDFSWTGVVITFALLTGTVFIYYYWVPVLHLPEHEVSRMALRTWFDAGDQPTPSFARDVVYSW